MRTQTAIGVLLLLLAVVVAAGVTVAQVSR